MVSSDEDLVAHLLRCLADFTDTLVDRLNGFDRCLHDAGMTNHVAVGEIADDDVVFAGTHLFAEGIADLFGAHLRHQVIGRELPRRRDQHAVLAGILLFHTAVEEERDMRVLLSLGDAQLLEPRVRDDLAHRVFQFLRRERHREIHEGLVISCGADILQREDGLSALESIEVRLRERIGHLTCAVRTEVHEDDGVAFVDDACGIADDRHDELVRHSLRVARFNRMHGVGILYALAQRDRVIALFHTVPTLVAVHAVEASGDRGDLAAADLFAVVVKLLDISCAGGRRHVTAVEEAVQIHALEPTLFRHLHRGKDVRDMAVHAAVRQQAQKVQRLALGLGSVHGSDVGGIGEEIAVVDRLRDARQGLEHHAAAADVRVADLGVAHLPIRETDVEAGGGELRRGPVRHETVHHGRLRRIDGVRSVVLADAVAIQDDECDFLHRAYSCAVAMMMVAKSTGFREAPPMRPPSMSGCARRSAAFLAFMEPPYWMVMESAVSAS